ncbi:AAA domain-containing protein, putative AbiEii toxin, Type IV TA system [Methanobrevibacter millerae]|uniref:AAA domain-containing protein, putative AbiEii toxin, Type IV TA system n=2 Tax=Methanobrevibacter millerae TaxID=230361 RepID=A0A1G5XDZ6_9EURY|nr:AAA domain-containing protein, putative AbiEii toxin, Type IV TA system [Methanobrevibacter millerae]
MKLGEKMSDLNINIHCFGPINHANIELKKLNVIAGINGSGKTTSSKLLYCFLESNSGNGDYLAKVSINNRFEMMITALEKELPPDSQSLLEVEELSDNLPDLNDNGFNAKMKTAINKLKMIVDDSQIPNKDEYLKKITDMDESLELSNDGCRMFFEISNVLLRSEFNIEDLKIDENTDVQFYADKNNCKFSSKLDSNGSKMGFKINDGNLNCLDNKNVLYIDLVSAFDLKNLSRTYLKDAPFHLRVLSESLYSTKDNGDVFDPLFNQKVDECLNKVNSLLGGYIYYDVDEGEFIFKRNGDEYHMRNTAFGVKQLGVVQVLLSNGILNENSFLIMDEPETHLHPEWQVKLAKLIILLIKELNISVFINSHSPHFIEALEVLSGKYGLVEDSMFYLSEESENNLFNFREIERRNLNVLYDNLGNSYDEIDEIRIENAFNGIE